MRITGSDGLLLTYLNSTDSDYQLTEILKAGDSKKTEAVSEEEKETYNEIKLSALSVQKDAEALLAEGEDSLFGKAESSGSTAEIISELGTFVEDYNAMVKKLTGTKDTSNDEYLEKLSEYYTGSKELLEEIGITGNPDGTLSVDRDTLGTASLDSLKAVCQDSVFFSQVSGQCDYIGANAAVDVYLANASNYTSAGSYAQGSTSGSSAMMTELYNTIGSYFDSQS